MYARDNLLASLAILPICGSGGKPRPELDIAGQANTPGGLPLQLRFQEMR